MLEVCHSIFNETPGRKGKLVPLSSQDVSAYIIVCIRVRARMTINSFVTRRRQNVRM